METSYQIAIDGCEWCECINGAWRWETWVTTLTTVSGLGAMCAVAVFVFLCSQCGHGLEGGQSTTLILLFATILLFLTLLPFCFHPGDLVCTFKAISPAASYTIVISIFRLILPIDFLSELIFYIFQILSSSNCGQ